MQIQSFPFRQYLVELVLAEHGTQRGLCELARGVMEVGYLDDRLLRIDDPKIDHRVDLDRDIVPRDDILGWHIQDHGTQVDTHYLLHAGNDNHETWSHDLLETPEEKHDAALVLQEDVEDRPECQKRKDKDRDRYSHLFYSCSGSTIKVKPSKPVTRTF